MRAIFSLAFILSVAPGAVAQDFVVTPSNLADWAVTGGDLKQMSQSTVLTLPAGAQIARSFVANDLVLNLATRPLLGTSIQDWPVIEVGTATIVFSRSGDAGQLLLIAGDKAPVPLPFSIPLGDDGRSIEQIVLSIRLAADSVVINADGQSLQFPLDSAMTSPTAVVLSAGTSAAWVFDKLEVVQGTAQSASAALKDSADSTAAGNVSTSRTTNAGRGTTGSASPPTGSGFGAAALPSAKPATAVSTLQIFTPPSVRLGRADLIRAALTNSKAK